MSPTDLTRRRQQDRAAIRVAQSLDAAAEEWLRADPELSSKLDKALAALSPRVTRRVLPQVVARKLAHASVGTPAAQARRLFDRADGIYWSVVRGWEQVVQIRADQRAARWGVSREDAWSWMRMSWFEAAMRYDPGYDLPFDTWARAIRAPRTLSGWRPTGLVSKSAGSAGPRPVIVYLDDVRRSGDDDEAITLTLTDDAEPVDEQVESKLQWERLLRAMAVLSERERAVLQVRYLSGEDVTLASAGEQFGLSRERLRQIERGAFWKLRDALAVGVAP